MLFTIQPRLIQPCRVQLQNCKSWMLHILLCTFFPPPYTHAVIYSLPCLCLKVTAIWGRLLAPGGGLHCSVLSCWPLVAGVFDSSFEEQLKKRAVQSCFLCFRNINSFFAPYRFTDGCLVFHNYVYSLRSSFPTPLSFQNAPAYITT